MQVKDIKNVKLFLFDMDGTLYLGDMLYDFTKELLDTIKKTGRRYLFMTNNSSKSVVDYVKKLKKLGIDATEDDFVTSSQATAFYIRNNYPDKTFYVCGTNSLKEELVKNGFSLTEDINKATAIVMGFDTELTFLKLENVCKILFDRDVPYIATNPDLVCPTEYGSVPDCGSVCEMIYNSTGKRPFVIGKPNDMMVRLSMEKTGYSKDETCVVGDRIYTDIKSGLNAGVHTFLVMSGETTQEILDKSEDKPELVLESGKAILEVLREDL